MYIVQTGGEASLGSIGVDAGGRSIDGDEVSLLDQVRHDRMSQRERERDGWMDAVTAAPLIPLAGACVCCVRT